MQYVGDKGRFQKLPFEDKLMRNRTFAFDNTLRRVLNN